MALQKSKTLSNGTTGNYWRFVSFHAERASGPTISATWVIALFKDKATSDAGGSSLGLEKVYTFPVTSMDVGGDMRALGYSKIKTKAALMVPPIGGGALVPFDPDLDGATDV